MYSSFAILSLFTSVALAQSSGTPAPSSNPLIPSGISGGCSSFLKNLDSDKSLTACTSALTTPTAAYGPGGDGMTSPSSTKIGSALSNLCSPSVTNSCPESLIRGKIADFYSACSAELTSNPNADVLRTYDVLYVIIPLKTAVCSKDDNGDYCATKTKAPAGDDVQKYLSIPSPALMPNTTTYRLTNLPFLFLQPSLPADELCQTCTRNILTAYINFESNSPYAPGLAKSSLLSTQTELYKSIQTTCPANFLSGAVQAAGGISDGPLPSGAVRAVIGVSQGFVAAGMGILALAVSLVL